MLRALSLLAASWLTASGALAAEPWPDPPFEAWVRVAQTYVRLRPDARAPVVGLLGRADWVLVTACAPSCDAAEPWALLGGDGVVRLEALGVAPAPFDAHAQSSAARFIYGRVRGSAPVHLEPDLRSRRLGRHKGGHDLAFRQDDALLARGWLQRPRGGFVPSQRIRLLHPSAFSGHHGAGAVAFAWRATELRRDDGSRGAVARYTAYRLLAIDARSVRVDGGWLPRAAVRLAVPRPRPRAVPSGARWVHVDLDEQVLTAYEGDRQVLATLVSTGKPGHTTSPGLYRVFQKVVHAAMHGPPRDPYLVDAVPYVLYFNDDVGLHGTFWHDRFGRRTSHGCVNLSMTDAEWLFDWAPPRLPSGWHAVLPLAAGWPTLHVQVAHGPAPRLLIPAALAGR